MHKMTSAEGPTIYVDLTMVVAVSPVQFQMAGPGGQAVPAVAAGKGAMLIGAGWQLAVRGDADQIAKEVAAAKRGITTKPALALQ